MPVAATTADERLNREELAIHRQLSRRGFLGATAGATLATLVGREPTLVQASQLTPSADAVIVLRLQKERHSENFLPSLREYSALFGLTSARLRRAKPEIIVLHPGPMNRGVEIDPAVADSVDALIETQVRAGLVVRMAVLYDLLTHGPVEVKAEATKEVA